MSQKAIQYSGIAHWEPTQPRWIVFLLYYWWYCSLPPDRAGWTGLQWTLQKESLTLHQSIRSELQLLTIYQAKVKRKEIRYESMNTIAGTFFYIGYNITGSSTFKLSQIHVHCLQHVLGGYHILSNYFPSIVILLLITSDLHQLFFKKAGCLPVHPRLCSSSSLDHLS